MADEPVKRRIGEGTLIRHALSEGRESPLRTYRRLTVGERAGTGRFILYELLTMFLGPLAGGLGFFLRKRFYPRLLGGAGRGLIIGRNVVIRHPGNIVIGNHVTIDDNCVLDGRGAGEGGLVIGDGVIINRNCMVLAKEGPVRIGARTTVGSNSVIVSTAGVEIGEAALMAGGCYISAGAYEVDSPGAIMDHEAYSRGPIRIGAGSWLGTCAVVLDGVSVGDGAVVGAGAVVNRDVAENAIVAGVPAKVLRARRLEGGPA